MTVFVEKSVLEDISSSQSSLSVYNKIRPLDCKPELLEEIEFVITLGGDGTLLYAAWLFQKSVPPMIAFQFGSLGFLAPFDFINFEESITKVIDGVAPVLLRTRLSCLIIRKNEENVETFNVLNEVCVRKCTELYSHALVDLFVNGKLITTIKGDGLIVATPTGSTAYSASAGASVIHPNIPAIVITPICPTKITSRPIVMPANTQLSLISQKIYPKTSL